MLAPGVELHVYGFRATPAVDDAPPGLGWVGTLHDGDWAFLVFTAPAEAWLQMQGLRPGYQARLPYEQWLDGEFIDPVEVDGLTLVPPWAQVPPHPERVLHVEPSLAFGTGAHPTTQRCLRLIAALSQESLETVLDLGCGSGVLSLAALRHGAHFAWGCDTCALAVAVAQRNAKRNGLHRRSHYCQAAAAHFTRPADLVLANLPPTALAELLGHPTLGAARWVISSGLLASHSLELRQNLPGRVEVTELFVDGPWHTLLMTNRSN